MKEQEKFVRYRLEKSGETLEVAKLLMDNNKWNSAVNRLYYAAYYAVSALLIQSDLNTKTHTGVKTQFFLHYVKSGIFDVESAKLYSDLFDWRQKGDYGDFIDFSEDEVKSIYQPIRELIENLEKEIEKKFNI